jgi:hypothetical protein
MFIATLRARQLEFSTLPSSISWRTWILGILGVDKLNDVPYSNLVCEVLITKQSCLNLTLSFPGVYFILFLDLKEKKSYSLFSELS